MTEPFDGVIWVTGASSGIGAAVAQRLAHEGYHVAASARRKNLLQRLARRSPRLYPFPCDCTDAAAVNTLVSELRQRFGKISGLIHCAGAALFKTFLDTTPEEFEQLVGANFRTLFLCLHAVLPPMLEQRHGIIISISSVAALKPFARSSIYGGLKAAAAHMLRGLREEVRSYGIKLINLHLGATATPLWSPALRRRWGFRMLAATEVAEAIVALLHMAAHPRLLPEELVLRPQQGDLP
jgi:short-subunit dehydrogenase